jgi:hypothetical protein
LGVGVPDLKFARGWVDAERTSDPRGTPEYSSFLVWLEIQKSALRRPPSAGEFLNRHTSAVKPLGPRI